MSEIDLDELARRLSRSLTPQLSAASQAIGAEIVNVLAPYPAAPPRRPGARRWYERGYGWRYAGGGGKATSEQMNRRWDVQPQTLGATVVNLASYSGRVQGAAQQEPLFKRIGWKTDGQAVTEIDRKGVIVREVEDAIRRTFRGLVTT